MERVPPGAPSGVLRRVDVVFDSHPPHHYGGPVKLYAIVDRDLSPGPKCAQAIHAVLEFAYTHPALVERWHADSNRIVVLEHGDVVELADRLEAEGLLVVRFREPDLGDRVTAICAEPRAARLLAEIPLAA